jgi:hypothetical protein
VDVEGGEKSVGGEDGWPSAIGDEALWACAGETEGVGFTTGSMVGAAVERRVFFFRGMVLG